MKRILTGAILLFSLMSFGQSLNDLDAKNGFRNDFFETALESYSNLAIVEESKDGYRKYYKKKDENFLIGDIEISGVYYGFYKGKLDNINFETKGIINSRGILDILTTNYGTGYQSNKYIKDYYWFGKIITISYKENSANHNAQIYIRTNINKAEQEKDNKESVAKAKI